MRKAFTLVELMVVVVVIAILTSISFKIAGLGEDQTARSQTITRLQKLENCISGYYAAFGSYPPVKIHGTRDIYCKVGGYGNQLTGKESDGSIDLASDEGWRQVKAACESQPVAMNFPFDQETAKQIPDISEAFQQLYQNGGEDSGYRKNPALQYGFDGLDNPGKLGSEAMHSSKWPYPAVFRFGLLSYLLPRYLVMMGHLDDTIYDDFDQWGDNNTRPSRFESGVQYDRWQELNQDYKTDSERWKIALLPSQAITARWIVNLQRTDDDPWFITGRSRTIYGVTVGNGYSAVFDLDNPYPPIYSPNIDDEGGGSFGSNQYVLDGYECKDGWNNTFYYYSSPPYQNYRLWSSGPDGKTFPPWMPAEEIEKMGANNAKIARKWIADDVVNMSN